MSKRKPPEKSSAIHELDASKIPKKPPAPSVSKRLKAARRAVEKRASKRH